jgi:hypothetical protein
MVCSHTQPQYDHFFFVSEDKRDFGGGTISYDSAWSKQPSNIRYLKKSELCRKRGGLCLQRLHLPLQLTGVLDLPLLGPRRRLPVRQDPAERGPPRNQIVTPHLDQKKFNARQGYGS